MGVLGYSAEKHIQVIQDESFEAGYDKCEKDITELYDWLFENNRISDVQKRRPQYLITGAVTSKSIVPSS